MRKSMLCLIALAVAGVAVASDIPPNVTTVVTKCGTPVAVYVTTRKGFAKYDGPVQVAALAAKTPYNLRVEAGCNR